MRTFVFVDEVLGSWWAELLAAVGSLRVVVAEVFVEKQLKVSLAEDQHSVGQLGSDGSHEPLSEAVRLQAARRDLHDRGPDVEYVGVEGVRSLFCSIPYEEPLADSDPVTQSASSALRS